MGSVSSKLRASNGRRGAALSAPLSICYVPPRGACPAILALPDENSESCQEAVPDKPDPTVKYFRQRADLRRRAREFLLADEVAVRKVQAHMLLSCMLDLNDTTMIEVNGTSLATFQQGSGDPVTLVHGGVSDLRSWTGQMSALSRDFRVLCYSRRFHAPHAPIPPDQPDTFQTHVDDLAALIDHLGTAPTHIVAHSWGRADCTRPSDATPRYVSKPGSDRSTERNRSSGNPAKTAAIAQAVPFEPETCLCDRETGCRDIWASGKGISKGGRQSRHCTFWPGRFGGSGL